MFSELLLSLPTVSAPVACFTAEDVFSHCPSVSRHVQDEGVMGAGSRLGLPRDYYLTYSRYRTKLEVTEQVEQGTGMQTDSPSHYQHLQSLPHPRNGKSHLHVLVSPVMDMVH